MKRITLLLETKHKDLEPETYKVVAEYADYIEVVSFGNFPSKMTLKSVAKDVYENEHRVRFTKVKPDLRKKPFSVTYVSGIGEGSKETKFATLAEVQEYVKGRWQCTEYIDGPAAFHGDFGHFYLKGCWLADLGARESLDYATDAFWNWIWKELS